MSSNQHAVNCLIKAHEDWVRSKGRVGKRAIFDDRHLQGVDFRGAYLVHASFVRADLRGARWEGAVLTGADFREARR